VSEPRTEPLRVQTLSGAADLGLSDVGATDIGSALRLVINLMLANLGLSVLTALLALFLQKGVLDYEVAHSLAPGSSASQIAGARTGFGIALWVKLGSTVLISAVFVLRAYGLRRRAANPATATRGAYLRLYVLCVISVVGIAYLILSGQYPVWMRVEQFVQALLLVCTLVVVSRKEVRGRFPKRGRVTNAAA
jgi:hypothetical protein